MASSVSGTGTAGCGGAGGAEVAASLLFGTSAVATCGLRLPLVRDEVELVAATVSDLPCTDCKWHRRLARRCCRLGALIALWKQTVQGMKAVL